MTPHLPIPLYLLWHQIYSHHSLHALTLAKEKSLAWKHISTAKQHELEHALQQHDLSNLQHAILQQLAHEQASLIRAMHVYYQSPRTATQRQGQLLTQQASSSLTLYTPNRIKKNTPLIVIIPPLINRATIMDLTPEFSVIQFLLDQDYKVALLDWGEPGVEESDFNAYAYYLRMQDMVAQLPPSTSLALIGYCMGGLFALGLASHPPSHVSLHSLALLSTPWDFHAGLTSSFIPTKERTSMLKSALEAMPIIPKDLIYLWFYLKHPLQIHQKFCALGDLSAEPQLKELKIAIERWALDGVAMTGALAVDCFVHWAMNNQPCKTLPLNPASCNLPVFVTTAEYDTIVPKESSLPLLTQFPLVTHHHAHAGHISMVAGQHAASHLWHPYLTWLSGITSC